MKLLVIALIITIALIQGCAATPAIIKSIDDGDLSSFKTMAQYENLELQYKGLTPLMWAAKEGKLEIVRHLLDKEININTRNDSGYSALFYAVEEGKLNVVQLLIDHNADTSITDKDGNSLLMVASSVNDNNNLDVVKYLLEKGADLKATDIQGNTPLLKAASANNLETVKYFLEKGADLNITNHGGETPLFVAIVYGKVETANYLVNLRNINIKTKDKYGNTPLHVAAMTSGTRYANLEILKKLLLTGVDLNTKNDLGCTPLLLATLSGSTTAVNVLLNSRVDYKVQNNEGMTAIDYAEKYAKYEKLDLKSTETYPDLKYFPYYNVFAWDFLLRRDVNISYTGVESRLKQHKRSISEKEGV